MSIQLGMFIFIPYPRPRLIMRSEQFELNSKKNYDYSERTAKGLNESEPTSEAVNQHGILGDLTYSWHRGQERRTKTHRMKVHCSRSLKSKQRDLPHGPNETPSIESACLPGPLFDEDDRV